MAWENDASGKACIIEAVIQLHVTIDAQLNDSQIGKAPREYPSRPNSFIANALRTNRTQIVRVAFG